MNVLQGIMVSACKCGKQLNVYAVRAIKTPIGMLIQQQLFGVIYYN